MSIFGKYRQLSAKKVFKQQSSTVGGTRLDVGASEVAVLPDVEMRTFGRLLSRHVVGELKIFFQN